VCTAFTVWAEADVKGIAVVVVTVVSLRLTGEVLAETGVVRGNYNLWNKLRFVVGSVRSDGLNEVETVDPSLIASNFVVKV